MIAVMPTGLEPSMSHISMSASPDQDPFVLDLIKSIIPYIDTHYRVRSGFENRARAALSMGVSRP